MDRVAVFVDAGYLFAQGSIALRGEKAARTEMRLDVEAVRSALEQVAIDASGLPLLRIYWYDGAGIQPHPEHKMLAQAANIKLRLGLLTLDGRQKGVDALIVTDMISLARNRAMATAVLLSGDDDLRVGVSEAQALGVRVHLLGIAPSRGSQSEYLRQEADSTEEWAGGRVAEFLELRHSSSQLVPDLIRSDLSGAGEKSAGGEDLVSAAAHAVADQVPSDQLESVVQGFPGIPKNWDGLLLTSVSQRLGEILGADQKRRARDSFRDRCETLLAAKPVEPKS